MGSNPWTYIGLFILVIVGLSLLFGVLFSLLMAVVGTRFARNTQDKYCSRIEKLLPGKNCGQCGFATCRLYADRVLHTEADEDLCPYGGDALPEQMMAVRKELQDIMEDPTPTKERKRRFFGGKWK